MDMEEPNRPSLSFTLGLVLLALVLFCMSLFFICCLHWDKLRSLLLLPSSHDDHNQEDISHSHLDTPQKAKKINQNQGQSLPVLMPGDEVPMFIAMACPCQQPAFGKITVKVEKPSS